MGHLHHDRFDYFEGVNESAFGKDVIRENRDFEFNLIRGDYCRIGKSDSDDRRSEYKDEDRDDLKHIPAPDPVPLPSSILLIGTALGVASIVLARRNKRAE
jgi:hypothetical protein